MRLKTWGQVKNETLGLMFLNSDDGRQVYPSEPSVFEYTLNMVDAANHGMRDLAQVRPLIRKKTVCLDRPKNLISGADHQAYAHFDQDIVFQAEQARSWYVEIWGAAEITVLADGVPASTVSVPAGSGFTACRGVIPQNDEAKLVLGGTGYYQYRNPAMYQEAFPEDQVPAFTLQPKVDLKQETDDFMALSTTGVVGLDEAGRREYPSYALEGDGVILFGRDASGHAEIYYQAYPKEITNDTLDAQELELAPEALDLLPYYMAGRLFAEDDLRLSTTYLNLYYQKRDELLQLDQSVKNMAFQAESGWI